MPLRSVLDTNVFVSGLLYGGPPGELLDVYVPQGLLTICTSTLLMNEVYRVLDDPKFSFRILEMGLDVRSSLATIYAGADVYAEIPPVSVIKEDPSDNAVLGTALAARADAITSGDKKHVLPLKRFQGIPILTAQETLRKLQKGDN